MSLTLKELKELAPGYYGSLELLCDGYEIEIIQKHYSKMRMCFVIAHKGYLGDKYFDDPEFKKRFGRDSHRHLFNAKQRAQMKKDMRGLPKKIKDSLPSPDKKFTVTTCIWLSWNPLARHLFKNCESITQVQSTQS